MKCAICGKKPNEILEYIEQAEIEEITPKEFVEQEEGTYDVHTGYFVCTDCYIEIVMPLNEKLFYMYRKLKERKEMGYYGEEQN